MAANRLNRLLGMETAAIPLLLQSALIGLSIAAPVGPIGLLCIQRTLDHGPRVGLATGLGAAVADALYGAIGAFGVTAVITLLTGAHTGLAVGGAIFLLWLAWKAWQGGETSQAASVKGGVKGGVRGWQAFGGTFLLTLSNPATILSFIAVFSSLAAGMATASPAWMIAGVFIGSAAWWLLLVGLVGRLRERLQAKTPALDTARIGRPTGRLRRVSAVFAGCLSPSSKDYLGRSPEGTAMLAGSTAKHIARAGRLGSGPALGPRENNRKVR